MVEEQQVSFGFGHFESTDPCVVDACLAQRIQIESEIMGQQRPNDVAVRHKHVGALLLDLEGPFDGRYRAPLDFPERFAA